MTQVQENPYAVRIELTDAPEIEFGWNDDGEFVDRVDSLALPEICYDTGLTQDLARRVQTLSHHTKHKWLTNGLFWGGATMHLVGFLTRTDWLRGLASWCYLGGIFATLAVRKTVRVTSFEHRTIKREREHRQHVVYSLFALAIPLSVLVILNWLIPGILLAIISVGAIAMYDNHRFKLRHLKAKPMANDTYAVFGFSNEFHETRRQLEMAGNPTFP